MVATQTKVVTREPTKLPMPTHQLKQFETESWQCFWRFLLSKRGCDLGGERSSGRHARNIIIFVLGRCSVGKVPTQ